VAAARLRITPKSSDPTASGISGPTGIPAPIQLSASPALRWLSLVPRLSGDAVDPQAPFGRDPATGVSLSDKSAATAGCLQLFLGVFGIGRFYIDSTQIAIAQLYLGLFGFVFSLFCLVGFPVLLGSII
jgi:TM2 domain